MCGAGREPPDVQPACGGRDALGQDDLPGCEPVAEGYGRETEREHSHFLLISLGSSNELETQLILSYDFRYVKQQDYQEVIDLNSEVNKMLSSLIYTLKHPN